MKLKALERIEEALKERPQELDLARQEGAKVVGYFCCNIPEEIIHALGLIPIRLCRGGNERLVEIGSRYASTKNCVFIRESIGLFAQGQDPFVNRVDLVAVAATCPQMYRLAELIKYYFGAKTVVLGLPRNFYLPEGREYFRREMEDFARQLEEFAGRRLGEDLRKSIALYKEIRETISAIYENQAVDGAPLGWREVFNVIHAGFYLDRAYYRSLLEDLLSEIRARGSSDTPPKKAGDESPRILLSGSIMPPGDTKLIDIIEEMGGRVVADDLCTGFRPFRNLVVKDFSVPGIADAYLDRVQCASLPYVLSPDTDRRLQNLSRLIDDYKPDGIIYHTLRYCDPFTFKATETKSFFKDRVSFLEIHTEYASADVEAIRTRVESFLHMISTLRAAKYSAEGEGSLARTAQR